MPSACPGTLVPTSAPTAPTVATGRSLRVLFLAWRDLSHPEGGGSERYVENLASALAAAGHEVTLRCAAIAGRPRSETREGFRISRGGGRLGVYPRAAAWYLGCVLVRRIRGGRAADVIVDVHNGVPFFCPLFARRGSVITLVHHVHREQWPVVFGPRAARIGWWIESVLCPRLYRGTQYVTVSETTKGELVELGVAAARIRVLYNGLDPVPGTPPPAPRSAEPRLCVLGRLVPHKRVELAFAAVALLRGEFPALRLSVIGHGWWEQELRVAAERCGVADLVDFTGFVAEEQKHRLLDQAWAMVLPSLKEGWGIAAVEAAQHGVPTVAFREAGGLAEAVVDCLTGLLVDGAGRDEAGLAAGLARAAGALLRDRVLRTRLGSASRVRAGTLTWDRTTAAFADLVAGLADGPADGPRD